MITDYRPLYPYILLTALGLGAALLDAFTKRRGAAYLGWLTAAGAIMALWLNWIAPYGRPWHGIVVFDSFSRAFNAVFLLALALVAIGSVAEEARMKFAGEYYA